MIDDEYVSEPDLLGNDVRDELMDQALAVVARLDRMSLATVAAAFPSSPDRRMRPLTALTRCFLEAICAHSSGDTATFLARSAEFLPAGAQNLPRAFRHLIERLATMRPSKI